MANQIISDDVCWTAVPHGFAADGTCLISVVASFAQNDLSSNSAWHNWGDFINDLKFKVSFKSAPQPVDMAEPTVPPLKDAWGMLFSHDLMPRDLPARSRSFGAASVHTSFSFAAMTASARGCIQYNCAAALRQQMTISRFGAAVSPKYSQAYSALRSDALAAKNHLSDIRLTKARSSDEAFQSSFLANQLKIWVADQIASSNSDDRSAARRVERNLYRLSSHPWTDLEDYSLAVAWTAGTGLDASQGIENLPRVAAAQSHKWLRPIFW
jgi:hypothetical protein